LAFVSDFWKFGRQRFVLLSNCGVNLNEKNYFSVTFAGGVTQWKGWFFHPFQHFDVMQD